MLALMNKVAAVRLSLDMQSEKVLEFSQVTDVESFHELALEAVEAVEAAGGDDDVVNVYDEYDRAMLVMLHVDTGVGALGATGESEVAQGLIEFLVPGALSLLQTIKAFLEQADFVFHSWLDEESGLLHVDLDVGWEFSLQEGCLDVEMVEVEVCRAGDGEECTNGGRHADGSKGLIIVDAVLLLSAVGNEAGFLRLNSAVICKFEFQMPLAVDRVAVGWKVNKFPGAVAYLRVEFLSHCSAPFGYLPRLGHRGDFMLR